MLVRRLCRYALFYKILKSSANIVFRFFALRFILVKEKVLQKSSALPFKAYKCLFQLIITERGYL